MSLRVPTPTVSLVDFVVEVERATTKDEINAALREASEGELLDILGYSEEPLVSMDYKGDPRSSIVDALSTMVQGDTLVKILSWYDNEWGYSCRVADLSVYIGEPILQERGESVSDRGLELPPSPTLPPL